jgi:3-oxoacyl-[acyl-carrier protein] reductase
MTSAKQAMRPLVVVSGGTGGIGGAVVKRLLAHGTDVIAGAPADTLPNTHADHTYDVDEGVEDTGDRATLRYVELDVSSEASCETFAKSVRAVTDHVEGLVNAAGILIEEGIRETSLATWQRTIDVNLTGTFLLTRALLPLLESGDRTEGRSSVVNLSSQLAHTGAPGCAAYAASKGGVSSLTRAMAHDLGPAIRVNCVAPGPVETPMTDQYPDPAWRRRKTDKLILRRFGTPDEIASAVMFLLSAESGYFTGQTLSPNGGGVMP